MFDRILLSTVAAASLLAATPALASEGAQKGEGRDLPPCCDRVAMLVHRHAETQAAKEQKAEEQKAQAATAERKSTQAAEEEDIDARNMSWGG